MQHRKTLEWNPNYVILGETELVFASVSIYGRAQHGLSRSSTNFNDFSGSSFVQKRLSPTGWVSLEIISVRSVNKKQPLARTQLVAHLW